MDLDFKLYRAIRGDYPERATAEEVAERLRAIGFEDWTADNVRNGHRAAQEFMAKHGTDPETLRRAIAEQRASLAGTPVGEWLDALDAATAENEDDEGED